MLSRATIITKKCIDILTEFEAKGLSQVIKAADLISQALNNGGKLLIFGNGGSAADAQHMTGEMLNRFLIERPSLPAIALTTDSSVLTAIANDYSFDKIFANQIKALGNKGDIALGISTSGRSPNVIKALTIARAKNLINIGLTGCEGQQNMNYLCDCLICVPSNAPPRIQEVHVLIIHILCELIEFKLFGNITK